MYPLLTETYKQPLILYKNCLKFLFIILQPYSGLLSSSCYVCFINRNPKGRTGLRGRGRLIRWGPNHYVMVVISRWKKKDNSEEFIVVDGKRLLEVVAIQKNGNREPTLPRVRSRYRE